MEHKVRLMPDSLSFGAVRGVSDSILLLEALLIPIPTLPVLQAPVLNPGPGFVRLKVLQRHLRGIIRQRDWGMCTNLVVLVFYLK
jgi:hypothetical protein